MATGWRDPTPGDPAPPASDGICIQGREQGLVLVRALYAEVTIDAWRPDHEMTGRRFVPAGRAYAAMWVEDGFAPMYWRIFAEAAAGGL